MSKAVPQNTGVTDHGLLRWLERVQGIDIEGLRTILAAEVRDAVRSGARSMHKDGFIYHFLNGALVTVHVEQRTTRKRRPKDFREAAE